MSSRKSASWLGLWIVFWCLGTLPAQGQPVCTVVAGAFEHVWGGLVQDVLSLDPHRRAAWLVEDGGRIRNTTNGGTTWLFQDTPPCVQDLLRGVHFLHGGPVREGWAVGDGAVLHTTDAGVTWTQIATLSVNNEPAELWDIWFEDQSNGYLAGNHILKFTTDGGVTWTDVTIVHPYDPGYQFALHEYYSIDFQRIGASLLGIAVAEPGFILRTTDGTNWRVEWDFCFEPPLCSGCAPVPPVPPVAGCSNNFEIWDVEIVAGAASVGTADVVAVAGFGNQCGQILTSQDGGVNWGQELNVDDFCNQQTGACGGANDEDGFPTLYGNHALDNGGGIAVGYAGTNALRDTSCSPAVWRANPQIQDSNGMKLTQPLFSIDGNGKGRAWIGSMFNGVVRTNNGGQSWTVQTTANDVFRLMDVYFDDASTGWGVGQFFRIIHSTDGGDGWTVQQAFSGPAGAGNLNDIVFDSGAQNGVAVGGFYSGAVKISITGNGGGNWTNHGSITPPLGPGLRTLAAVTSNGNGHFWAVGATGTVLFSTNSGQAWENIDASAAGGPTAADTLNGVAFLDPDTGFVVGRRGAAGKIFRVTNATNPATRAWQDVSPVAGQGVLDFQGVAAGGGVAVAVGKRQPPVGAVVGTVFRWNGTGFAREITPRIDTCHTLNPTGGFPFFSLKGLFNEVAVSSTGNEIYVGGSCGRFLRFDAQGWQEVKSHTSMHITGMSFYGATEGFVHATTGSHGVIVKYDP